MRLLKILPLALIAVGVAGCSEKNTASTEKAGIPVSVISASMSATENSRTYVGTVEELSGSMLSFEVNGNVERIAVDAGDKVRKGQVLASLNEASMRSMHDAALATLNQAQDAYRRYEQLYKEKSLPDIKWIEVESKLQQAKSTESIARKNLEDCVLHAPFSGYIASREVEPGMNVMPGQPVLKLVNIDEVKVKVSVPENEIAQISIGEKANFTVAALDGRSYAATVSEKSPVANAISHTYEVKMQLANADGQLLPGMICSVAIAPKNSMAAIVIPVESVKVDDSGARFVWIEKGGKAWKRRVAVGNFAGNGIEIRSGLTAGEHVITSGSDKVSDGMKVVVK